MAEMTHAAALAALVDFASVTRRMLEPGLQTSSAGKPLSTGSCLHASVLAASLWNRFHGGGAVVRGGDGELQQGARDAQGRWCGHYRCEMVLAPGRFIVDITPDQFGHEAVRVLPHDIASGVQYRAGDQVLVDAAVAKLAEMIGLNPAAVLPESGSDT